jgi:hypothetical protein
MAVQDAREIACIRHYPPAVGAKLEDMPAGLGEFIQEEHAVAGQREFPAKGAGSI